MKTTKYILAFLLTLSISTGLRAQVLDVKEVFQEMDQWCWVGVSDCFLDYYGCPRPQCEIVDYTRTVSTPGDYGYVNVCMDRSGANHGNYIGLEPGDIPDILMHFAGISLAPAQGPLDYNGLANEFAGRRPIIIRWAWDGGGAHYILGHGLVGQDMYYMNPWPGEGKKIGDLDWMKAGSGHSWSVTGFAITSPKSRKPPKPNGDSLLFIDSGNSTYSTSGVRYASSYDWILLPEEAGTVYGNDTLATIDWSDTFSGTAQLTVNGRNRSGSGEVSDILDITILPSGADPTLRDLSVNNFTIDGFASNVFDYYLDMTSASIPVIEAVPKNPDASIIVTHPTSIPGKAEIEVTAADNLKKCIYTIYFQMKTGESWSWASCAGGRDYTRSNGLATDNQGNVVSAGFYNTFSVVFGTQTLYHSGGCDVFVVRYNPKGTIDWALSSSDQEFESASGITTDPSGNVYVIGDFKGEYICFGTDTLRNTGPLGSSDIFIVKIDPSGKLVWMRLIGSGFVEQGNSIASDKSGNIYATGMFTGRTINIGSDELSGTGGADIFLCKLSSSGDFEWAISATGDGDDVGNTLTTDLQGNVVLGGTFSGNSISLGSSVLYNEGVSNILIAKIDPSGNVIWAKNASGDGEDYCHGICTDSNGDIYVTGEFGSDRINFGTKSIYNSGETDIFLTKYSSAGEPIWTRGAEGAGMESSLGVTIDASNNAYITGVFESRLFHFGDKYLPNQGRKDIFITKFDPQGSVVWTKWAGGCNEDVSSDIKCDPSGNIFVSGMFSSPDISFGLTTLENDGKGLMYVAKLSGVSLSVDQLASESSFLIYPNPSFGEFKVECPNDTFELRIFDSKGSLVRLISAEGQPHIELKIANKGLFFVQVRTAEGISTKKLIVINDK